MIFYLFLFEKKSEKRKSGNPTEIFIYFPILTHRQSQGVHVCVCVGVYVHAHARPSKPFVVAGPPSACRSILTSNVCYSEINIKLLNILVRSWSKVEVFFLTGAAAEASCNPSHHPASPLHHYHHPQPPPHRKKHCVQRPSRSITRHLEGEKALSEGGVCV